VITVFVEQQSASYIAMFRALGFGITANYREADFVCLTGGEDVTPALYGDTAHKTTYFSTWRDEDCKKIFDYCQVENVPMVGICRGGQFLNVMSGGRMYQDVEKHTTSHYLTDHETGEVVYVSSTHHQMMMPGAGAQVIATSNLKGKREWFDDVTPRSDIADEDYEVVYYPTTKCLCFQPHPEFNAPDYQGMKKYFHSLINRFLQ